MAITLNGTTGITNDGGYTGDGVSFADTTPSNTLVTTTGGNVGIGKTPSTGRKLEIYSSSEPANMVIQNSTTGTGGTDGFLLEMGSSDALIVNYESGAMRFFTSATERMRINSSGDVGIGTDSPAFASGNGLEVQRAGDATVRVERTGATNSAGEFVASSGLVKIGATSGSPFAFITDNTERMRISSDGRLLVNRTTAFSDGQYSANFGGNSQRGATYNNTDANTGANFVSFGSNGTVIGTISQNGSSNVTYSTSSDYRLKENIAPMTGALSKVALLKPVTYTWKADGSDGQGFIAHELSEVVPDCVVGEKDAVETYIDEDGIEQTRPKYQGIDTSFLVATLTAAIQEQQAIITEQANAITALEARLTALEQA